MEDFVVQSTTIPQPSRFNVAEGQFDDAEIQENPEGQDKNYQNLEAIFHSSLKFSGNIKGSGKQQSNTMEEGELILDDEEDEDSDLNDDDDYAFYGEKSGGPNSQKQQDQVSSEELFRRYANKITVEKYEGVDELPTGAGNKIITASKKMTVSRMKVKDKQDRATVEQVMDPRTRMILYKLLSSEKILSIDGCISTGKEANVYHATGPEGKSYAIKIFKTSILTFKARDKYVSGEYRFRQGYCKKNPRKMVRLWAEKEYRNLLRIHSAGTVLVPEPKLLKSHVLVMDFIGNHGWPCPLLKDVKFETIDFDEGEINNKENQSQTEIENPLHKLLEKLYRDSLLILYRLYKHCKLVHADFSEFNLILKDDKDLFVIDVSQSVEHDHPRSFDFLRTDIKNVQDFFGKRIHVGDFKDIFDFVTSPIIDDSNCISRLDNILKNAKKWENMDVSTEVFRQSFIPRKMDEVEHYERDYNKAKQGETELIYTNVMGMKSDFSGPQHPGEKENDNDSTSQTSAGVQLEENQSSEEGDSTSDDTDSQSENSEGEKKPKTLGSARPKDETADQKRERKKQVKQDKAEKRQTKVKKHIKKRNEKVTHHNSKKK